MKFLLLFYFKILKSTDRPFDFQFKTSNSISKIKMKIEKIYYLSNKKNSLDIILFLLKITNGAIINY